MLGGNIFHFHSKASDAHTGIIAILVHFEKTLVCRSGQITSMKIQANFCKKKQWICHSFLETFLGIICVTGPPGALSFDVKPEIAQESH